MLSSNVGEYDVGEGTGEDDNDGLIERGGIKILATEELPLLLPLLLLVPVT